jgi:glycosyltransferase involved in cell wall biosynthesis
MPPLISIISTNYNNGPSINDMVRSMQEQSLKDWQLIIVDDGSTDNSRNVILELSETDSRILPVFLKENHGAAYAFNQGISFIKAPVVGRLDSDDALDTDALSQLLNAHQKAPECAMICSHAWECDDKLRPLQLWPGYRPPSANVSLLVECTLGSFATFKTSKLLQTGGMDETLRRAVDLDLYLRLEELGRVSFINVPLYLYRQHHGGISQGSNGIAAYQWSRFVRLNANTRRRRTRKGELLNPKAIHSLAYEWLVTELCSGECGFTKFEILKYAIRHSWVLAFYPKVYFHLLRCR